MFGVSFYTLGCKLNQLETESVADAFADAGFSVLSWERRCGAALVVINTCTVTSKSEQKARRIIRLALQESRNRGIIITGCYAQLEGEKLATLEKDGEGRLFIIPGATKDILLDLPGFLAGRLAGERPDDLSGLVRQWLSLQSASSCRGGDFRFNPGTFSFHTRAFFKIQDGCDKNCAYCRVPLARGKSRSLDSFTLLERVRNAEKQGCAEAVLTGVSITQYICPETGKNLGELLLFLLKNTVSVAVRLSSIEPGPGFPDSAFLGAVSHKRIRPHFHLSVQSGSAAVLAAMGRSYGPEAVAESAALLRSVKDDPFLACDMIAGFPGETGEDFECSYRLAQDTGFAWVHAFPFSPRPGTAAWNMGNRVNERETARRLKKLGELARLCRTAYTERWTGRIVDGVLLENFRILTGNYLRLFVPEDNGLKPGAALRCRITGRDGRGSHFDAAGEIVI